ncbi:MAG: PEGA domain-containing protein [Candidatus Syntrophosphaera sp.]|nr:PEGA domain-containing protein [Candidatus Syntrophosphaera sp.]
MFILPPLGGGPVTYTLTVTSDPAGAAIIKDGVDTGFVTPYTFDPGEAGLYSLADLPGYYPFLPASIDVPALTEDTTINFTAEEIVIVDTYTYMLYVNGPDGYAVTGPYDGVTDYTALDVNNDGVNDLVGFYTIADAPVGSYWLVNPIEVTGDMFVQVPPAKSGLRSNGAKVDYVFEATIEFVLVTPPPVYTLTVTSTPAGAAIWLDGVDTGQVTPYTWDPGVAGTYSLATMAGYYPFVPTEIVVGELVEDTTINFLAVIIPPDEYIYNLYVTGPDGYAVTGPNPGTTDYMATSDDVADLVGLYTIEAAPAGWHWVVNPIEVTADMFTLVPVKETFIYEATIEFVLEEDAPPSFTFELNAFDNAWYTGAGYIAGVIMPPFNDPHDLNAMILIDGVPTGVFTPYIFGAPGNLPFVPGEYSVYIEYNPNDFMCYDNWIPASVTIVDIITNYFTDFLGINDCPGITPVELSSFTAALNADMYVTLTWVSQTESQMTGYRVYRNTSNDQASSVAISGLIPATNTSTTQSYSITDTEVNIGQTYFYWLEAADYNSSSYHGPVSVVVEGNVPPVLPETTTMRNAYPNPFKMGSSTTIEVNVKAGDNGTVSIYNVLGQVVKTISVSEGTHTITWNGKDSRGNACGSGIYFYKLSTSTVNATKKMVIVK